MVCDYTPVQREIEAHKALFKHPKQLKLPKRPENRMLGGRWIP